MLNLITFILTFLLIIHKKSQSEIFSSSSDQKIAFHSHESYELVNGIQLYKSEENDLKRYTLGLPTIVPKRNRYESNLFSFGLNSFYIMVELLSEQNKIMLKNEFKNSYDLDIQMNQIHTINIHQLKCRFNFNCNIKDSSSKNQQKEKIQYNVNFVGQAKNMNDNLLKVEFNLTNQTIERKCFVSPYPNLL